MGGKITAQFGSTSQKFQNSFMIYLLIITVTSKWKLKNTSASISVSTQSRSYASAASHPIQHWASYCRWPGWLREKKKECHYIQFSRGFRLWSWQRFLLDMWKQVYNSDISVNKVVSLRKKSTEKRRPCWYVLNMMKIKVYFSLNHIYYRVVVSIVMNS